METCNTLTKIQSTRKNDHLKQPFVFRSLRRFLVCYMYLRKCYFDVVWKVTQCAMLHRNLLRN